MKLKIIRKTAKPFQGDDGESRDYFWYIAEQADGTSIRFGSTNGSHEVGAAVDPLIEKYEQSNGKTGYKEIS